MNIVSAGGTEHQQAVLTSYVLMFFLMVEAMELVLRPSLIASPKLIFSPLARILLHLVTSRSMSSMFFSIFAIYMLIIDADTVQ